MQKQTPLKVSIKTDATLLRTKDHILVEKTHLEYLTSKVFISLMIKKKSLQYIQYII